MRQTGSHLMQHAERILETHPGHTCRERGAFYELRTIPLQNLLLASICLCAATWCWVCAVHDMLVTPVPVQVFP